MWKKSFMFDMVKRVGTDKLCLDYISVLKWGSREKKGEEFFSIFMLERKVFLLFIKIH